MRDGIDTDPLLLNASGAQIGDETRIQINIWQKKTYLMCGWFLQLHLYSGNY